MSVKNSDPSMEAAEARVLFLVANFPEKWRGAVDALTESACAPLEMALGHPEPEVRAAMSDLITRAVSVGFALGEINEREKHR